MRTGSWILGWSAALSIVSASGAHQLSPVTGRVTATDAAAKTFDVATSAGDVAFLADARTVFVRSEALADLSNLRVGEQIRVLAAPSQRGPIASRVETLAGGAARETTVTGCVAAVDIPENRVTIDMPKGSAALETINTGDPVRIHISTGDDAFLGASGSLLRRSLGVWLIAMAGALVALRVRHARLA